jgi:predicted dehydrogenase
LANLPTEHVPAVQALPDFELKAIYSRSQKSAEALTSTLQNVDTYYDSPSTSDQTLASLLKRDDIQAVIIALPINNQPDVIRQCLKAGKHVLSEKPIARDVKDALALVQEYEANHAAKGLIWGVAENWRYQAPYDKAAEIVKELKEKGGKLVTFRLQVYVFMSEKTDYYHTEWLVKDSLTNLS